MPPTRVLVVDDIGTVRAVVRNILVALKVHEDDILQAANGEQALQLLQDETLHLVVTDWTMPGASGLDVARAASRLNPKPKIVFLTSNNQREEVLHAVQAGANDYVIKPFTRSQLVQKLSFWISQVRTTLAAGKPLTEEYVGN